MRKFLFFLLLIPMFASLGHDLYLFQQNPDKGFRLSALGALWDKYHKESHDKWKDTVRDMGETVSETVGELDPTELMNMVGSETAPKPGDIVQEEDKPDFMQGFTQTDAKDQETKTMPVQKDNIAKTQTNALVKGIGFALEQKAVFVFAAIAALAYLLNAILSWLFRPRQDMDEIKAYKKKKRKGGGYSYSRK